MDDSRCPVIKISVTGRASPSPASNARFCKHDDRGITLFDLRGGTLKKRKAKTLLHIAPSGIYFLLIHASHVDLDRAAAWM